MQNLEILFYSSSGSSRKFKATIPAWTNSEISCPLIIVSNREAERLFFTGRNRNSVAIPVFCMIMLITLCYLWSLWTAVVFQRWQISNKSHVKEIYTIARGSISTLEKNILYMIFLVSCVVVGRCWDNREYCVA